MKIFALILAVFFALIISNTTSESQSKKAKTGAATPEKLTYKLTQKFPLHVYNLYELTDNYKITRKYDDGTETEIEKTVTFFMTFQARVNPIDGFMPVHVIVDSARYRLKQGGKEIVHNSMGDAIAPLNIEDYFWTMTPEGKEFEVTYSPYAEVVNIGGSFLEELIFSYKDPIYWDVDSVKMGRLVDRLTKDELGLLADISKGIIPVGEVTLDTSWTAKTHWDMNQMKFDGIVNCQFSNYNKKVFSITGIADSLQIRTGKHIFNDIPNEGQILSGSAKAKYDLDISTTGNIEKMNVEVFADINAQVGKVKFTQTVHQTTYWKQFKRLKF